MEKLDQFISLWKSMTPQDKTKCLTFLTAKYGLNLLKTCEILYARWEKKRGTK